MNVWMIIDVCYVDENGLEWLLNRRTYEVSEDWGREIIRDGECGAESIKVS